MKEELDREKTIPELLAEIIGEEKMEQVLSAGEEESRALIDSVCNNDVINRMIKKLATQTNSDVLDALRASKQSVQNDSQQIGSMDKFKEISKSARILVKKVLKNIFITNINAAMKERENRMKDERSEDCVENTKLDIYTY